MPSLQGFAPSLVRIAGTLLQARTPKMRASGLRLVRYVESALALRAGFCRASKRSCAAPAAPGSQTPGPVDQTSRVVCIFTSTR